MNQESHQQHGLFVDRGTTATLVISNRKKRIHFLECFLYHRKDLEVYKYISRHDIPLPDMLLLPRLA